MYEIYVFPLIIYLLFEQYYTSTFVLSTDKYENLLTIFMICRLCNSFISQVIARHARIKYNKDFIQAIILCNEIRQHFKILLEKFENNTASTFLYTWILWNMYKTQLFLFYLEEWFQNVSVCQEEVYNRYTW